MQLIILGMHRSGTSMQTRLLNLAGAYFGPEGANTGANDENPKGFWERRDVRALNDSVLHSIGCDWNRAADLDLRRVPAETLEHFNRTAARIVLDMDAYRPWVMKEPRLCLLFGLWRKLLDCPVAVNVFRHPLEVASSLRRRNGIPVEVGLALWKLYVASAASAARGIPSVTSFHQDFVAAPYDATCEMVESLRAVGVQGLRVPMRGETESFVSRDLYRERLEQLDFDPRLAAVQIELFEEIRRTRALPEGIALTDAEIARLRAFEEGLPPLEETKPAPSSKAEEKIRELSAALTRTKEGVDRRNARIEELEGELRITAGERERLEQQMQRDLASHAQQIERERASLEQRFHLERVSLEEQLQQEQLRFSEAKEGAQTENARLQLEHATLNIRIERLEAGALRERTDSARKTGEIARLTRLLIARESQLSERETAVEAARKQLAIQRRELEQLRSRFDDVQRSAIAQVQSLDAEIRHMRGSVGWKVMTPARWIARRIAAVRGIGIAGDRKLVLRSGLFDRSWYMATYVDVRSAGLDPVEHYLLHGAEEGRDPGPGFSTRRYLKKYPDVAGSGMNPLLHFILHGQSEGRLPH